MYCTLLSGTDFTTLIIDQSNETDLKKTAKTLLEQLPNWNDLVFDQSC